MINHSLKIILSFISNPNVAKFQAIYLKKGLNFNFFIERRKHINEISIDIKRKLYIITSQMEQFSVNFLLLISSILGMYLFMSWTTQQSWNSIINFLYSQNTTASLNQQFEIMVTTGYYLVLVFITGYLLLKIYKYLRFRKSTAQEAESSPIVKTVYDSFRTTFYEFITFLCLYFYFIRNHDDEITERQLILIPFWYLTARVLYILGYLMTTISGVNIKNYGITLTIFVYAFMLAKSFGYNLFLYL